MIGCSPRLIELKRRDKKTLETLAHGGSVAQRVAQRARVLLATPPDWRIANPRGLRYSLRHDTNSE